MPTKERLFDRLWKLTEETRKDLQKPFVERKLRRKFNTALDAAQMAVIEAQEKQNKMNTENLVDFNINNMVSNQEQIKAAQLTEEIIKEQYLELFGEPIE